MPVLLQPFLPTSYSILWVSLPEYFRPWVGDSAQMRRDPTAPRTPTMPKEGISFSMGGARELPVSISSQIVWLWLRLLEFLHCLPVTKFKQVIPPFNTCEIDIENWKMFSIRRPVIIILNYTNCLISMCF